MGADFTSYCLQELTDYTAFESLCHDLMALVGYRNLEPLGGFSDKGRDAIHVNNVGITTVFAYSAREDWRAKLSEDAAKVAKHGHRCDRFVFITTSAVSASERDEALKAIDSQFNWDLDLYPLERLRVLLDAEYTHVKLNHPAIFSPALLAIEAQVKRTEQRDHLFISFAAADAMLAEWLSRKLTAEGYMVWCRRFEQLGGERYPDDEDGAIQTRAAHLIALYSDPSLKNPDLVRQRAIALGISKSQIPGFLIPLRIDQLPVEQMDQATRELVFIPFEKSWAEGLRSLLAKLEAHNGPRPVKTGRSIAASAFLGNDVVVAAAESVITNCLPIVHIPDVILRYRVRKDITQEELESIASMWAIRYAGEGLLLSFHQPPQTVVAAHQVRSDGRGVWRSTALVAGISTKNLVSELLRKSLLVHCGQKGLAYCAESKMYYFPFGLVPTDRIRYARQDGASALINTVGERKYRKSKRGERFKYYLSPDFFISQQLGTDFMALIRVRVRITDTEGNLLASKKANSRRKDLCHDWWNHEWLSRQIAICQFLSEDGQLVIGLLKSEQVIVSGNPMSLEAPKGVNEEKLGQDSLERDEFLYDDEDDDEEEEAEV